MEAKMKESKAAMEAEMKKNQKQLKLLCRHN
jgi:hypothetical protein